MREGAGRSVAAYCLLWLDDAVRAVEMETVGTVLEHRGRGWRGRCVLAGLRAARAAGAKLAVVAPRGDDVYPVSV